MKICMIIASIGEGGLEKHTRELSQQLLAMGHQVTVLAHESFLATLSEETERCPIPAELSRRHPRLLWYVLRHLRRYRYDIIHAQANKAAAIMATLRRMVSPPIIGTLHNIKRNTKMFCQLNHTITVSKRLAQSLPAATTTVVYNGIQPTQIEHIDLREKYQLATDKPVLCSVGRLVEAKGFDLLLEAVSGLSLSLLIAGDGPLKAKLIEQIATMPSETEVYLIGHVEEAAKLMASADGVVISSRREGFSYVFVEAVMAKAKILSTPVPVSEILQLPSELTVAIDDMTDFREKVHYLMTHQQAWHAAMEPIYRRGAEELTLEKMTDKTLAVYRDVLGKT